MSMTDEQRQEVFRLAWWKVRNAAAFFALDNGNENPPWQRPFRPSPVEHHLLTAVLDFFESLGRNAFGATSDELRGYLAEAFNLVSPLCEECIRVGNARCLHNAHVTMKFGG